MTRKQELIKHLKKMRSFIQLNKSIGLCSSNSMLFGSDECYLLIRKIITRDVQKLRTATGAFYFPENKEGKKIRLRIIDDMIKHFSRL